MATFKYYNCMPLVFGQNDLLSFYASAMTMAGALSVTPVHPSVRTYVQRRPLSKSNTFDQNFMKLGHIVL